MCKLDKSYLYYKFQAKYFMSIQIIEVEEIYFHKEKWSDKILDYLQDWDFDNLKEICRIQLKITTDSKTILLTLKCKQELYFLLISGDNMLILKNLLQSLESSPDSTAFCNTIHNSKIFCRSIVRRLENITNIEVHMSESEKDLDHINNNFSVLLIHNLNFQSAIDIRLIKHEDKKELKNSYNQENICDNSLKIKVIKNISQKYLPSDDELFSVLRKVIESKDGISSRLQPSFKPYNINQNKNFIFQYGNFWIEFRTKIMIENGNFEVIAILEKPTEIEFLNASEIETRLLRTYDPIFLETEVLIKKKLTILVSLSIKFNVWNFSRILEFLECTLKYISSSLLQSEEKIKIESKDFFAEMEKKKGKLRVFIKSYEPKKGIISFYNQDIDEKENDFMKLQERMIDLQKKTKELMGLIKDQSEILGTNVKKKQKKSNK